MQFGVRELLFVLLLLAMPVAAYFFVFQPRNIETAEAREENLQKEAKLQQLNVAKATLDINDEIDRLTEALRLFQQKLPEEREVEVILEETAKLAAEHNLKTRSFRTDRKVTSAEYARLPIKMQITGDFDGFYEFLQAVEKLPRITQVTEMKLERKPQMEEGQMQADLVLSIFFEGAKKPAARRKPA